MTDLTDEAVKALLDGATENAYDLEVVKLGGGIRCIYLNDYRVAGEKPWGGGDTTRRFKVRMAVIMRAFRGTVQAAAPDLARALLDARAELARVKADAAAAQALVVEQCAEEADRHYAVGDMGNPGHHIRALADLDGLAMVQELRVEARENAMQALASMGQAQEAYEAQLEAEAELAAAKQREAELLAALEDPLVVHLNMVAGKIAKPLPSQLAHIYGEDVIRAALAPTPTDPGDGWTWHERLGWIGPDGKPAARGGA